MCKFRHKDRIRFGFYTKMAGEEGIVETVNSQTELTPEKENDEQDNIIEYEGNTTNNGFSESGILETSVVNKSSFNDTATTDSQTQPPQLAQNDDVTEKLVEQAPSSPAQCSNERLVQLPLSRIKVIMKSDPAVTLASQEAIITLTKATELFISALSKDAVVSTINCKRKTLQRKDLDTVLDTRDGYAFLEGTLD